MDGHGVRPTSEHADDVLVLLIKIGGLAGNQMKAMTGTSCAIRKKTPVKAMNSLALVIPMAASYCCWEQAVRVPSVGPPAASASTV